MNLLGLRDVSPGKVAGIVWDVLRTRPRSLVEDAEYVVSRLRYPLRVENSAHVPSREPFVLVANHYEVPGLWVGWVTLAITLAVSRFREPGLDQLHWVMTSEWPWLQIGRRWIPAPLTPTLFPRACKVWGLVPTSPNPADVAGRARGLRQLLAYLGRRSRRGGPARAAPAKGEAAAMFPEGRATIEIQEARVGAGAFLHRLSGLDIPLLPVGTFLDGGVLVVRFGPPFFLDPCPPVSSEQLDGWAGREVMLAIGRLLPPEMWGGYAPDLQA